MRTERICPFCQNPVRQVEADGVAYGYCLGCKVYYADRIKGRTLAEGEFDYVNDGFKGNIVTEESPIKTTLYVGSFQTLEQAEKAVTARSKKGSHCYVEHHGKKVSEWFDGDRADLKRKHITVMFSYTDGSRPDGSSEIITTEDQSTFRAIEYYLLKRDFKVRGFKVTDDDGNVLEVSE